MGDCLEKKAHEAADELNEFRKKSPEDMLYTVGGWGFDAAASAAASAMVPGAGVVFGGVVRTGEKAVGKALVKKAGKEALEEVAEHTDEAAARRLLHQTEERARKEAEKRGTQEVAERAVAKAAQQGPRKVVEEVGEGVAEHVVPAHQLAAREATQSTSSTPRVPSQGRANRQARLREIADDPNASSADRGWIQQDINEISEGKRLRIRNPPGKELAHERGREAAKGYDYAHSNLQDADLHKTQHKYDNFGRKNRERPVIPTAEKPQ
jgi:hypothetical protein